MAVKAIPDGYHTITPYMVVTGVERLLEFLETAFGAKVLSKMPAPDGAIMHAEVLVGDSKVMLGEASEKWSPRPGGFYMYVEDVDASYKRAMDAGGTSKREPTTEFYGDRSCGVEDPSGNQWWMATHVEDVSEEEMDRRAKEYMASAANAEASS